MIKKLAALAAVITISMGSLVGTAACDLEIENPGVESDTTDPGPDEGTTNVLGPADAPGGP